MADKTGQGKNKTISDVANELGLSKTTISRAISGKGRIGESTRKRVLDYIQKYNYKPNVIAKGLAQSKTYNIGVVIPDDSNLVELPFFHSCLMGICETAAGLDYDVIVTTVSEGDLSLIQRLIDNRKVDGVILTRTLFHDSAVQYLKTAGIPFVVIGSVEDDEIIQVDSDHVSACFEMTSILLMSGCKSVAFLSGNQDHIVNQKRYEGFVKAYKDKKTTLDKSLVYLGMNSKGLVQRAVDAVLKRNVDCILCSDDNICSMVLAKLNEDGIIVPNDVKVASFYNSAYLANYNPPITAVHIDVKNLGAMAGKRLIDAVSENETIMKTQVAYELFLKKSTM